MGLMSCNDCKKKKMCYEKKTYFWMKCVEDNFERHEKIVPKITKYEMMQHEL